MGDNNQATEGAGTTALTAAPVKETAEAGGAAQVAQGAGQQAPGEAELKQTAQAEIELTLPEGFQADEKLLGEFKGLAKELGLKVDGGQKLVELYAKAQSAALEKGRTDLEATQKKWADALKSDKEVGGQSFDPSVHAARKAMAKYATPELTQFLEQTGLGNHPELFKFVARIGKAMSEDSVAGVTSNGASETNSQETFLRAQYPTMFNKEQA